MVKEPDVKKTYRIAVIPGDGIGKEVAPEGVRALEEAANKHGFDLKLDWFDFACVEYYEKYGRMMPLDWKAKIGGHDAIFFGAVGWPAKVPDHVSLWGSLVTWRREFDQYVNLRPVRLMPGVPCPLVGRKPGDIDFYVVRENTEGEYSNVGGRMFADTEREFVVQETYMTRIGVDRVVKFAFELARTRPGKHLTSATKSNGISITMPYWDERVEAVAKSFPDVRWDKFHIDILTANFVLHPDWFDVVVGSRYPVRPRARLHRDHRHRAERQHQSGRQVSIGVRAGSRLRPRHRRAGHRQSHRPDLVGRHDARPPRRKGRRPRHRGRDRARARRKDAAHPRPRRQRRHRHVRQGGGGGDRLKEYSMDLILRSALLRASRRTAANSCRASILRDGRPSKSAVADFDTLRLPKSGKPDFGGRPPQDEVHTGSLALNRSSHQPVQEY